MGALGRTEGSFEREELGIETFVLIHGLFGSAAELAPVIPELEARGQRAFAVDLPSPDPAAMVEDYVDRVAEAIEAIEGPVVLVGHSAGGMTISLVPDRVEVDRLVYVTALVPEPGRSIADLVGDAVLETILTISRDDGDGCRSFDFELRAAARPPDERPEYLAYLSATQRPQGWAVVDQPWPGRSLPAVPCRYVVCSNDTLVPPETQRAMAARLGVQPDEIAVDHAVFSLRPRDLAALLTT